MFHTGRACRVWSNLQPCCTCRTTIIFGTLKDGSQKINSLSLKNCFSYRNVLQNGVNDSSKKIKNSFFCQKVQLCYTYNQMICFKFGQHVVQMHIKYAWRDFRLPVSSFALVAWKSFNFKFTVKIGFPIDILCEVWSLYKHYLISIWTTCWWNLNKITWYNIFKASQQDVFCHRP